METLDLFHTPSVTEEADEPSRDAMQAYRLPIAEGYQAQVVKLFVEPSSNCAGFLLADASCILASLSPSSTSQPTSIPAPCTGACFVRLQVRLRAGADGSAHRLNPVERAASGISGAKSTEKGGKLGEAGGTVGDSLSVATGKVPSAGGQRGKSGRWLPNDKGVKETVTSRVFFLTTQPGNGGSYIDLNAWLCEPPSFTRTNVGVHPGKRVKGSDSSTSGTRTSSRKVCRLDIPHGLSVKMVASVNVVVVYSITVGKIWVMAAKHVPSGDLPGIVRCPEVEHLVLMKCAVVDFSGPVYSLHVSMQHLLLGECGGVWIWPLRPLIKGDKRQKRTKDLARTFDAHPLQTPNFSGRNGHGSRAKDMMPIGLKQVEDGHRAPGVFAVASLPEDSDLNAVKEEHQVIEVSPVSTRIYCPGNLTARSGNGLSGAHSQEKEQERIRHLENLGSIHLKGATLQGFEQGKLLCYHGDVRKTVSYLAETEKKVYKEDKAIGKHESGQSLAFEESKDGLSRRTSCEVNDLGASTTMESPLKTSLCNPMLQEDNYNRKGKDKPDFRLTAAVVHAGNGLALHNSGGLGVSYNSQGSGSFHSGLDNGSILGATEERHAADERTFGVERQSPRLGLIGPRFVPICSKTQRNGSLSAKKSMQKQVVDIQEISARRFVVLDSNGDLHLLVLHNLQAHGTSSPMYGGHPKMTPLDNCIKVAWMAVLHPAVQSLSVEPSSLPRRIWISDGCFSNYVVSLSGKRASEDSTDLRMTDLDSVAALPLVVSRAVFISDSMVAIAAVSAETVLVVTQGSIIAYVITGS